MQLLSIFGKQQKSEVDEIGQFRSSPNNLKLTFQPYWDENPYQKLLVENLANLGVKMVGMDISISSAIKGQKPDILHLHWLHPFIASRSSNIVFSTVKSIKFIIILLLLKLAGVKIIWTAHNLKSHDSLYPLLDGICTSIVAKLAQAIIVHGETAKYEIATKLKVRNKDKIFVVPHGNYSGYYENSIDRVAARKLLNIPSTNLVFLFIGLIRPYKGVLEMIEAFKHLHYDKLQLAIAGKVSSDELHSQISQKSENSNIMFIPGFVPDNQLQVYMNACDIVVFPYQEVLTSGAAILAMSFGKACIAPRMGCFQDVLDDSGAFLYDPDIKTGLFQAMTCAIQNRNNLLNMGMYNQQLVTQWSWDRIAQKTLDVYLQC
jgi:beta-1,4-mannosyltransferase